MSDIVIKAEGLGKRYRLGQMHSDLLSERLSTGLRSFSNKIRRYFSPFTFHLSRKKDLSPFTSHLSLKKDFSPLTFNLSPEKDFWALKDVSFEVRQGEVVGIIGRNGAGKSTLLKILSRITEPTEGMVELYGRVGSLLEVGTGFHPELTGRENIFLNGAILGMKKAEIRKKFDEIVAFAEVEKFLDTPVKRYSSGMYVRLAFAVAAHLEPEILLVDEVLAVGDAQFQKKCLGKMGEVAKEGRTVLFVSHNMAAVKTLCESSLLLHEGSLEYQGKTMDVINRYLNENLHIRTMVEWDSPEIAPGNDKAKLLKAEVQQDGSELFSMDKPVEMKFIFMNLLDGKHNIDVTFHLVDEQNVLVFASSTAGEQERRFDKGIITARCWIPANLLNEGTFTISRLLLVKDRGVVLFEHHDTLTFEMVNTSKGRLGWRGKKEGIIKPNLNWEFC